MTTVGDLLDLTPEPWMAHALCAETDPDSFFPEKGGRTAAVIAVCRACPVTHQCLQFALDHNEHGVWGATSEQQRRRIRARQAAANRSAA